MTAPLRITSSDNPRIKKLLQLREQKHRRESGLFIAEGRREVERALAAGLTIIECYRCPDLLKHSSHSAEVSSPAPGPISPIELTPPLFRKVAYNENPEGILGVFEQPDWGEPDWKTGALPKTWPSRLSGAPGPGAGAGAESELWLVAVGTAKPGNLGAMARSAEAAGACGILVDDPVVDPFNPNAIRTSTAAVFFLPIIAAPAAQIVSFLTARKVKLLATSPDAIHIYSDVDMKGPCAIVIGPEDRGLDPAWFDAVAVSGGQCVAIPLRGKVVDSLNASNAAAVMLFEALRQRQTGLNARRRTR